jgi:hypothetical protein
MPSRTVSGSDIHYGLICFDANGNERTVDPEGLDGKMSSRLLEIAAAENPTNIFIVSHGWRGDVPAAIQQYDEWIRAVAGSSSDVQTAASVFPRFKPLFIGLHWPSEPWGDEEIGRGSFDAGEHESRDLCNDYAERLGDTPEIRAALSNIFDEAGRNAAPEALSDSARKAILDLNEALGLESNGIGGDPDSDREPFDPDAVLAVGIEAEFGGLDVFGGILGIVRILSYWTMKKRARLIGENGMHCFVKELQRATAAQNTRIHLMGHSFGCIVIFVHPRRPRLPRVFRSAHRIRGSHARRGPPLVVCAFDSVREHPRIFP